MGVVPVVTPPIKTTSLSLEHIKLTFSCVLHYLRTDEISKWIWILWKHVTRRGNFPKKLGNSLHCWEISPPDVLLPYSFGNLSLSFFASVQSRINIINTAEAVAK
jgi:hypothetical protein